MLRKLLTVIIPVFNTENYLERCLESVLNQSYKNIEIIAVDDASTDNSKYILEKYNYELNNEEIMYLAIHINKIVSGEEK